MQQFDTHEVFNQAPALEDVNLFDADPALREAVQREGAGWAEAGLHDLGARLGRADMLELGRLANVHTPALQSFDSSGRRVDRVEFHPAWHQLMGAMIEAGVHSAPWSAP